MNGSGYNKSKRRDSGVIPFADDNPFPTIKLNSISESRASTSSTSSNDSLPKQQKQQHPPQRGHLNRVRRPNPVQLQPVQQDPAESTTTSEHNGAGGSRISARRNVQLDNIQTHIAIAEDS